MKEVQYQIHVDENVILVMMRGNIAQAAITYVQLLLSMKKDEIERIVGQESAHGLAYFTYPSELGVW